MTFKSKSLLVVFMGTTSFVFSQSLTQTIRGTVVDKVSQSPLPGATIVLLHSNPLIGVATDPEGNFKLNKVPVGNHSIKVSFVGYKDITLPNIIVNSGKEIVL